MKVSTRELEDKLVKILKVQMRDDVGIELFKELSEKALEYKEMIDFLKDDDIDKYLQLEEKALDQEALAKHTGH